MEDGRIPKDILYGQLALGRRPAGRPMLRFKDVCKRDMKLTDIDPNRWELAAADRGCWRHTVHEGVRRGEEKRNLQLENKREQRKQRQQSQTSDQPSDFICLTCGKDCHARIGRLSHSRRCLLLLLCFCAVNPYSQNVNTNCFLVEVCPCESSLMSF